MKRTLENQVDLADLPAVWRWLKELAKRDPVGFLYLTRGNIRPFALLWGKAHWQPKDHPDWTHGWSFSDEGLNWIILSGPRGTSYRLRPSGDDFITDPKVTRGAVAFLERLLTQLTPT